MTTLPVSMHLLEHNYPFDPTHGYDLQSLETVGSPDPPDDFEAFWRARYDAMLQLQPKPVIWDTGEDLLDWRVFNIRYTSTDAFPIKGWLLLPLKAAAERAVVVTHGYGGRQEPDTHIPLKRTALLFPCLRGLGRSARQSISSESHWHVLHDVDKRDRYIIGGCVEDVWMGVSMLLRLFPDLDGHIGYMGVSFGGGIGALACPWDDRIRKVHLSLPTFGNHPLRLGLENIGSGQSLQRFYRQHGDRLLGTLRYYDAATAARFLRQPTFCALALFDPFVPPAGQFAVANALPQMEQRFLFSAGHHDYPEKEQEDEQLVDELCHFFDDL